MLGLKQPQDDWFERPIKGDHVELTYLGTAGFVIKNAGRTLVIDPFINRPGPLRTLFGRLHSEPVPLQRLIPDADDVLVGHAHYDHILDAPTLCQQTGARLIGSSATMMVGRAAGLPESQLRETSGREDIASGNWTLRSLPSVHGKALFGRIPLPGDISQPPPWPPKLRDLRHGLVLNWWIDTNGLRIVHIDTADFIAEELTGLKADLVCLCAIGRRYRPNYVRDVIRLLKPRWVLPCHWDTMMTPIDAPPELIPGVDLPGMLAEIEAEGAIPLLTPLLGKQAFPCCHTD